MCWNVRKKKKEEKVKVWRFGLMNNDWIINASQRMFLFFCSISFFFFAELLVRHDNIITWIRLRSDWHELCVRKKCSSLIRSEVIAFVAAGSSKKTKKTKTQDSLNRAQLDAKQSSIIWIYPALTHPIQADWLIPSLVWLVIPLPQMKSPTWYPFTGLVCRVSRQYKILTKLKVAIIFLLSKLAV